MTRQLVVGRLRGWLPNASSYLFERVRWDDGMGCMMHVTGPLVTKEAVFLERQAHLLVDTLRRMESGIDCAVLVLTNALIDFDDLGHAI